MRKLLVLLGVGVLAACGGGAHTVPAPPNAIAPPSSLSPRATSATFTIRIPSRTSAAGVHAPRYVSSSTQSIVIKLLAVNGNAYTGPAASIASNLTPSNPACTGVPLTCTVAAPAIVGSDLFSVTTYDAQQTSASPAVPLGQVLSQASVTVAVVANQANVAPPLVLNGVAASIGMTGPSGDPHVLGTQNAGYQIIGNQPYAFTIAARDADGNVIIDPGAPALTVQSSSNALLVMPVNGTTNSYTVRARRFSQAPVVLHVTASNSSVFLNVAFTTIQELWVANAYSSTITAYAGVPPAQIVSDTITRSSGILNPSSLAFDDYGRLWVTNYANVTMFAGSTQSPADTITAGLSAPIALAFDSSGVLWVADWPRNSPGSVNSYSGTSQLPGTISNPDGSITGLWGPRYLAFDAAGTLWVANGGGNVATVTAYSGTAQLTASTITGVASPFGLAFDGSGALWVASSYPTNTINPYSGPTLIYGNTISAGLNLPAGIAFDASGNLWVANSSTGVNGSTITEYAGTTQVTGNTIATGISGPIGLTFAPPATLPVNPPPPHPSPSPAPLIATPSSVAFSTVGSGFQRVTVSQAGYFGDYSLTNSNPSVASADQSGISIIVRPLAVGKTVLRMTGGYSQYVDIPVVVSDTGSVVASPSSLAFTNIGSSYNQTVALTQAGFSGTFILSNANSAVAAASISNGTMTVTPLASGTTTVRVTGGSNQYVDVPIGVTVSNVIIHSKHRGAR